jgi:outer membrane protein OmpA-like peptidoglycan-associated protein
MVGKRVVSLCTTASLLACQVLGSSACGWVLTKGPPAGYQNMTYFSCTEGNTGPVLDLVWAGLNAVGAIELYATQGSTSIAASFGLLWFSLWFPSGVAGLRKTAQCRAAKEQWASHMAVGSAPAWPQPAAPAQGQPAATAFQKKPPSNEQAAPQVTPPQPTVAPASASLVLRNAFRRNSAVLISTAMPDLDRIASQIRGTPNSQWEIGGFTSSIGSAAANLRLSQQRADAVRAYLVSKGVPADALTAVGYGTQHPVATNGTAAGRAQNIRVEIRRVL